MIATVYSCRYALGGFDGKEMVSSVEIFDPRLNSWIMGESMNQSRGYAATAVVKEKIYVVGGLRDGDNILDTVYNHIFKPEQLSDACNLAANLIAT